MQRHVATFHKAASNWTRRLFRDVADRLGHNVWVDRPNPSPINQPVERDADDTVCIYIAGNFRAYKDRAVEGEPILLCVRDPKDIVVSQYFSWVHSHANNSERILTAREKLAEMSPAEGMKMLVNDDQISMCRAVRPWRPLVASGAAAILKYEDLIEDFEGSFERACAHLQLDLDAEYVADLKEKYSFKALAKREPGDEDQTDHYRKGVPGDWKNHFDAELAKAFNAAYGDDCKFLGYELA